MTEELEKYYENRLAMFASQGWKDLMDDVRQMLETTDTVQSVQDLRQLGLKQGEVSMMNWLLTIEDLSRKSYKELKDNNDDREIP